MSAGAPAVASANPAAQTIDAAAFAEAPATPLAGRDLRALAYVARRLAELPVAVVLAAQSPVDHVEPAVVDTLRDAATVLLLARRQGVEAALGAEQARVDALRARYRLYIDAHLIWGLQDD